MDPSYESIVEIAIARNTATAVKSVSQANARGYLSALKDSIERNLPGETLQTTETDTEGLNTQSVLRYARLLMPAQLLGDKTPPRNFAYKQGGKCLTDFSNWARDQGADVAAEHGSMTSRRRSPRSRSRNTGGGKLTTGGTATASTNVGNPAISQWVVAPCAGTRRPAGWSGWPGILFPVMSALSAFVVCEGGRWMLEARPVQRGGAHSPSGPTVPRPRP